MSDIEEDYSDYDPTLFHPTNTSKYGLAATPPIRSHTTRLYVCGYVLTNDFLLDFALKRNLYDFESKQSQNPLFNATRASIRKIKSESRIPARIVTVRYSGPGKTGSCGAICLAFASNRSEERMRLPPEVKALQKVLETEEPPRWFVKT